MIYSPLLISLPIADRARAHAFYRDALGLEAVGELTDDGVSEPLLFVLNADTRLMLVPTGGFGRWLATTVASPRRASAFIGIVASSEAGVKEIVERARRTGRTSRRNRRRSRGATRRRSPTPTATSRT